MQISGDGVYSLIIKQILHSSKGELSHTLSYEATSHDQTRVRVNIFTEGEKSCPATSHEWHTLMLQVKQLCVGKRKSTPSC